MSSEDDTTQPLAAANLDHVENDAPHHRVGYANHTYQTGTLPSTTLGGSTDETKFLPPELVAAARVPAASAFPVTHHVVPSPAYHKPVMSQSESAMFDEGALFPDSNTDEVSKPNHTSASPQIVSKSVSVMAEKLNNMKNDANIEEEAEKSEITEVPVSRASSALDTSTTSGAPLSVKAPRLDSDSLNVDDEEPAHTNGETEHENGEKLSSEGAASNDDSLDEGDMEKDLADIQDQINKSLADEESEIASRQKAPARTTRGGRRKPSASQGVAYDYYGTGTLHNDSEDEDGGWGSDDEAHATQTLMSAPKLDFGSDDEGVKTTDEDEEDEIVKENAPATKKRRIPEYISDSDEEQKAGEEEYGDMEMDEVAPVKKNQAKNLEVSVIEDDEEENNTVSRPRPSLGNVGRATPTTKAKAASTPTKATTKASSTPTKATAKNQKEETAMDVSDSDGENGAPITRKASAKASTQSTQGSAKKASSTGDKTQQAKSTANKISTTPAKKTKAEQAASQKSLSQSQAKSQRSVAEDSTPPPTPSQKDGFQEEVSSRPKRTREAGLKSPSKAKKGSGDRMPSDELARLLRLNAQEAIIKYLEEEAGDDMDAYYTQKSAAISNTPVEPPSDLLKNFQFIVTGLRSTGSNNASSASWIKLQIKALGGKLVNARSANRLNRAKLEARKRGMTADRRESVYLPQCILISEKPQRTLKYVNALVNSVPCVHYRWFLTSLHMGKLLPLEEFMLPAGYNEDAALVAQPNWMAQEDIDEIDGNVVLPFWTPDASEDPIVINSVMLANQSTEKPASAPGKPHGNARSTASSAKGKLKVKRGADNYRVQIIGIPSFQAQWKTILTQAGAKIVDRLSRTADYGRIDFVLSDSEPTDLSITQATQRGLPLCTIDWALQSIIQRKVQDPKSKPAYSLNIEEWN